MPLHHHPRQLDSDETTRLLSRRAVLRRSAFGIVGIGLTSLLAACGDDDEDSAVDEPVGDQTDEDDGDAMDSEPLDPDSTAIGEEIDIVPETVEEGAGA